MVNKKGLSEIVTTLLFVLLAIGAVILVWTLVRGQLAQNSVQIVFTKACNDLNLQPISCTTAGVITYKRGNFDIPAEFTFTGVKFVLELDDGSTSVVGYPTASPAPPTVPLVLEQKSWTATVPIGRTLKRVGTAAVLRPTGGLDTICPPTISQSMVICS